MTLLVEPGRREQDTITVTLHDPRFEESVRIGDRSFALHRNLTASVMKWMTHDRSVKSGVGGVFFPGSKEERTGIYFPEPYREGTDVLVLTHGLLQSPYVWADLVNRLQVDREFSRRYTIAVGYYPTGLDPNRAAELLTKDLVHDRNELGFDKAILVGHSLGGVVTRLMISKPDLAEQLPFIKKAVYLSAPFGGSPIPMGSELWHYVPKYPKGMDALRPGGPFMTELGTYTSKVPSHVVAGVGIPRMATRTRRDWKEDARGQAEDEFWDAFYLVNQLRFRKPFALGHRIPNDGMVSLESMLSLPGTETTTVLPASHGGILKLSETHDIILRVAMDRPVPTYPQPLEEYRSLLEPFALGLNAIACLVKKTLDVLTPGTAHGSLQESTIEMPPPNRNSSPGLIHLLPQLGGKEGPASSEVPDGGSERPGSSGSR